MVDPCSNQRPYLEIDGGCVQSCMERFHILSPECIGKHVVSPVKQVKIEISVAARLGTFGGLYNSKLLDKICVENYNKIHFMINVDNGRSLWFSEEMEVKYADVVNRGEGSTMLVRLTDGRVHHIIASFMVFKNLECNYPIRNVPNTVPGVACRTEKKCRMVRRVVTEWLFLKAM